MYRTTVSAAGLHVTYRNGHAALNDVSFTLRGGETLAVVGESGSGKSTLGLALLGLLPYSADVRAETFVVNERDVLNYSETDWIVVRRSEVSMVFQEPLSALDPTMMVGAQIAEAVSARKRVSKEVTGERVSVLLRDVNLPTTSEFRRRYPHQLSGGQRQRIVIAIALANDPSILVADEPTTALDVTVQQSILELLSSLCSERGISLLVVTHDLSVVSELADRVLVLFNGQMVQIGDVSSVLNVEPEPYTRALLSSTPSIYDAPRTKFSIPEF